MPDDLARRAHTLFTRALDEPEADRERFVHAESGGDEALLEEVMALLRSVEHSTDFLEQPVVRQPERADAAPSEFVGPDVPGYRAVRVLGAGGMATVYEAEQQQPRRSVAMKVMHQHLAHTSAVQRFAFESEVLATLKHPGIAQIYEAGTFLDASGRSMPYFTMEMVEDALPITRHVIERDLPLRDRLALFVRVCDAVRYGHQAGVIHRDLKPSNVLVDPAGDAKVIDFGIARSMDSVGARITLDTDRQKLIGTLNYMSPEQCTDTDRVDTRSDVYSLGVILYELVSGRLPQDLSAVPLPEALATKQRGVATRPSEFAPVARGDLDAIVMRAMDADRDRRYPTASELGADVERLLANEPVEARNTTALYQLRKFAQRHRPIVLAAAGILLTLVAGVIATSWMALEATRARRAAELREQELERVSEFQRSQLAGIDVRAMGEGLRASLGEHLGPDASLEDLNFTSVALELIDESLLQRSHDAIREEFADQPLLRARLLLTLAATMNTLGLPERAERVLAESLGIRMEELGPDDPDTLVSMHATGSLLGGLGRYEEALVVLQDAYERRTRVLGPDDPGTLNTANTLAGVYRRLGRHEEAEALWVQTLEARRRTSGPDDPATLIVLNNVGLVRAVSGDLDGAESAWRELVERRRRVHGEDHPAYRSSLHNLGLLMLERGDPEAALPLLEASLEAQRSQLGDEHPSTLNSMIALADVADEIGETERAEALLREGLEARRRVLGADHPATLRTESRLAELLAEHGDADRAVATLESVLGVQRELLGDSHPDTVHTMHQLAEVYLALGRASEAEQMARLSVDGVRAERGEGGLVDGMYLASLARSQWMLGQNGTAASTFEEAYESELGVRGAEHPLTRGVAGELADLYESWHRSEPGAGHDASASRWRERADAGAGALHPTDPHGAEQ